MTAWRVGGGIAAAVLAALLIWLAATAANYEPMVMPTVSLGEGGAAQGAWADRAKLMGDRSEPGEISGVMLPATGSEAGANKIIKSSPEVSNPRQIVESWKLTDDVRAMLNDPVELKGVTSVPYRIAGVLQQPEGRNWRQAHNSTIMFTGGWLILGVSLALALFLLGRGRVKIVEGESGETVERFNEIERANHWMTASAFIILALTGLIILYGKPLLLPLIGEPAFGGLAQVSVWLHMAAAIPLTIGIIVMVVLWLRENVPSRLDWEWLKRGGGFLSDEDENPPARKFNAGQKIVFWGVTLGGLVALVSGITLMFPFFWLGYDGMQWTQLIHAMIGLLLIALIIGHIYIGTVGMQGAIDAMWSGNVDRNWAKEHHSLWYGSIKQKPGAIKRDHGRGGSRPQAAE